MVSACAVAACFGSAWVAPSARAQCETQRILPMTSAADAAFGDAVDLDLAGKYPSAIIGAPGAGSVSIVGSITMLERVGDTWTIATTVADPTGQPDARFGEAVAVRANTAVVGAGSYDDGVNVDRGIAHVLVRTRTGWSVVQTLAPAVNDPGQAYGAALDLDRADGATLFIAAPLRNTGAVEVWTRAGLTWNRAQTLTTALSSISHFGSAVAVDGDDALVIARSTTPNGVFIDAVAIPFHRTNGIWFEGDAWLVPEVGLGNSFLPNGPSNVALHDGVALIGAPADDHAGFWSGAVHVYERSGSAWTFVDRLEAPDGAAGERFGAAVALTDVDLAIAAPFRVLDDVASGAVFIWSRDDLSAVRTVLESTTTDGHEQIGASMALDGETVIAGAPSFDENALNGGSALVFATFLDCNCNGVQDEDELAMSPELDCNGNGVPDDCDLTSGASVDCNANLIPDSCDIANGTSPDQNDNEIPDECEPTPANDSCLSPAVITPGVPTPFTTVNATTSTFGETCGVFESDAWYRVVATCSTSLIVRICDANFDVQAAVYTFACPSDAGAALGCATSGGTGDLELIVPIPTPGLYRIRIGSANDIRGVGTVTVACGVANTCPEDCVPAGGNGAVDVDDLMSVINAMGATDSACDVTPVACDGTIGNGVVNIDDVVAIIREFGPCD
jgi:hypothetical protein